MRYILGLWVIAVIVTIAVARVHAARKMRVLGLRGGAVRIVSRMPLGTLQCAHDGTIEIREGTSPDPAQLFHVVRDGASYRIRTSSGAYWYYNAATPGVIQTTRRRDSRGLFTIAEQSDGAFVILSNAADAVLTASHRGYFLQPRGTYFPDQGFDFQN